MLLTTDVPICTVSPTSQAPSSDRGGRSSNIADKERVVAEKSVLAFTPVRTAPPAQRVKKTEVDKVTEADSTNRRRRGKREGEGVNSRPPPVLCFVFLLMHNSNTNSLWGLLCCLLEGIYFPSHGIVFAS